MPDFVVGRVWFVHFITQEVLYHRGRGFSRTSTRKRMKITNSHPCRNRKDAAPTCLFFSGIVGVVLKAFPR